jgi:hypothetical protein
MCLDLNHWLEIDLLIVQRSMWTLYSPGQGSTRIRRRIDGESWGAKYFFTVDFSGEPTQIMRRQFVEYLGTDCFHFLSNSCRVSVVSASNTKRRPTKPSSNAQSTDNFILLVCSWWFIGSWQLCRFLGRSTTLNSTWTIFILTNNTDVEYLAFLSQQGKWWTLSLQTWGRWESVSRIRAIQTWLAWTRRLHNVHCSV